MFYNEFDKTDYFYKCNTCGKLFISEKIREVSVHKPSKQTLIMEDIQEKCNHLLQQNEDLLLCTGGGIDADDIVLSVLRLTGELPALHLVLAVSGDKRQPLRQNGQPG